MLTLCFAIQANSLDPKLSPEGKPFGPWRYKEIVRECYVITKNCNTSYTDVLRITPAEKAYLIEFIARDAKETQDRMAEIKKTSDRQDKRS